MGSAWRLPGYRVEQLIGVGAFGEVWRATVRATGAGVALKRIPMTDTARRAAAVSEAAVLGALDHPHLIRLHRLERVDGAIVLVLDLAAGGSLHELLGARGRLTPGEVNTAMSAVAAALAQAHAAQVVHGDVTPANVLFSELGLPLLGDLGVARLVGDSKPVHTTLPYADPQVAAGYLPEPSSDVFMVGAVTMHAVTGHAPPSAAGELDPDAWSARIAARLTRSDVPPAMAAVIVRALSLEPHRRGTAADFALDLRHCCTPVAVEVAAGRARAEPSLARLAALAAGRPAGADAGGGSSLESEGKGEREPDPWPVPGRPPITHGVRLPSPMPSAAARHRARRRSILLPAAILVAATLLITAALMWWPAGDRTTAPPAAAPPAPVAPRSATIASPSSAAPGTGPLDVAATLHVLATLDAERARAFAQRDPQQLQRVYRSTTLLARDRSALAALVPPGCGLQGVRTSFTDLRIGRADDATISFTVTASLHRSTLTCGGTDAGHAPGAGPVTLQMTLVRSARDWLVAAQHPAQA